MMAARRRACKSSRVGGPPFFAAAAAAGLAACAAAVLSGVVRTTPSRCDHALMSQRTAGSVGDAPEARSRRGSFLLPRGCLVGSGSPVVSVTPASVSEPLPDPPLASGFPPDPDSFFFRVLSSEPCPDPPLTLAPSAPLFPPLLPPPPLPLPPPSDAAT